jgi:translocation and assembly module TamB
VRVVDESSRVEAAPPDSGATTSVRPLVIQAKLDLGNKLRIKGRGLDARLGGVLNVDNPGRKLGLKGTVRAEEGSYDAYGQKLEIERGQLEFIGPLDDPRLNIYAVRPNLDVKVGVLVTGSALNPRVRLASDTDMSELDKLSWLMLGRATDGLGQADVALLQRAALALLLGEGGGPVDGLIKGLGLTDISLRQTTDANDVRTMVVSVGKQLSRRWYVGYERSVNAAAGTWQLIYRVAQSFTLRAQSGEDSALDLIWSWRWE